MSSPTTILATVGILGAIAYAASRSTSKKTKAPKGGAFTGPGGIAGDSGCFGDRLQQGDAQRIRDRVDLELPRASGDTPDELAFEAASAAMRYLCPRHPVPAKLYQTDSYRASNGPGWAAAHQVALSYATFRSKPPAVT